MIFALLLLLPAQAFAFDPGPIINQVNPQVLQAISQLINSGEMQTLIVRGLFAMIAAIFWLTMFGRSAIKHDNALVTFVTAFLTLTLVATGIRLYDAFTDAGFAFGRGLNSVVVAVLYGGEDPINKVMDSLKLIHADSGMFNLALLDPFTIIGTTLIITEVYLIDFLTWAASAGAGLVYSITKFVGYLAIPFVLFRSTSQWFAGAVGVMAGSIVFQPVMKIIVWITALFIDRVFFITGGAAFDLLTMEYSELAALFALLAIPFGLIGIMGALAYSIFARSDFTMDLGGTVRRGVGTVMGAGRRLISAGQG